jgi:enoyl-CoA hydratase
MSAPTANLWGLVNRIAASGEALKEALVLAGQITANAPLSTLMTKRIIQESARWSEDEIWDRQRPLTESVLASEDAQEGARAFAEKRAPDWKGK